MGSSHPKISFDEKDKLIIETDTFKTTPGGIYHKNTYYSWEEGFDLSEFDSKIRIKGEELYVGDSHWSKFISEKDSKKYSIAMKILEPQSESWFESRQRISWCDVVCIVIAVVIIWELLGIA